MTDWSCPHISFIYAYEMHMHVVAVVLTMMGNECRRQRRDVVVLVVMLNKWYSIRDGTGPPPCLSLFLVTAAALGYASRTLSQSGLNCKLVLLCVCLAFRHRIIWKIAAAGTGTATGTGIGGNRWWLYVKWNDSRWSIAKRAAVQGIIQPTDAALNIECTTRRRAQERQQQQQQQQSQHPLQK